MTQLEPCLLAAAWPCLAVVAVCLLIALPFRLRKVSSAWCRGFQKQSWLSGCSRGGAALPAGQAVGPCWLRASTSPGTRSLGKALCACVRVRRVLSAAGPPFTQLWDNLRGEIIETVRLPVFSSDGCHGQHGAGPKQGAASRLPIGGTGESNAWTMLHSLPRHLAES